MRCSPRTACRSRRAWDSAGPGGMLAAIATASSAIDIAQTMRAPGAVRLGVSFARLRGAATPVVQWTETNQNVRIGFDILEAPRRHREPSRLLRQDHNPATSADPPPNRQPLEPRGSA